MFYVLRRHGDGAYVAPSGSQHSYTLWLDRAKVFTSREAAERDRCGNERIAEFAPKSVNIPQEHCEHEAE